MNLNRQGLPISHTPTKAYLISKTEIRPKQERVPPGGFTPSTQLKVKYPDVRFGNDFYDHAIDGLKGKSQFGALIIRMDPLSEAIEDDTGAEMENRISALAGILNGICKKEHGGWGQIENDTFACFFPGKDETGCIEIGKQIQTVYSGQINQTVSLGVAQYPTLNFSKPQIFKNARKALNHAAFFGSNSWVKFDAVSLNISGDEAYQKGDIKKAIKEFKNALKLNPADINVHNSLGVCYATLNDWDEAIACFETARWLNPDDVMAIYNMGLVSLSCGNPENALSLFLAANEIQADVFEVLFQTGRIYFEKGNTEKGEDFFQKAIARRPTSAPAHRYLGDCHLEKKRIKEAVVAYKKALKYNPNDAASLSAMGYLFDLQGENLDIAATFCEQSVAISPENGLFRYRLGQLYLKLNQQDKALKELQAAAELGEEVGDLIEKLIVN
jgi:tetratricopeptide (TPR) repeat protein